jgi:hypothetical protein
MPYWLFTWKHILKNKGMQIKAKGLLGNIDVFGV